MQMKREILQSTRKGWSATNPAFAKAMAGKQAGFSLVEVILSSAVFVLLVTALVGAYLYGQEATALAGNRARANMLAEEGLEAVRNIRDNDFASLTPGSKGLAISANQWVFSGASDATDIFTRSTTISPVGGASSNRKNITASVTWQQNPQRIGTVSLVSRLTNWQATNMASILSVNISGAALDPGDNTKVIGVTIQNIGDISITVDAMTTVWSGAPGKTKIEAIRIGGITVWSGSDVSNKTQDITNVVLAPGSGPVAINFLDFSKNMTGTTLTLTFTMSDGTASTTPAFNL